MYKKEIDLGDGAKITIESDEPFSEDDEKIRSNERLVFNRTIEIVYKKLYQLWRDETINISSMKKFDNKYYKIIISLGRNIVPVLIEQLREGPAHLYIALQQITGVNPIKKEHYGNMHEMANDWICWYDNIYKKELK
jgi:hypothetical protein